MKRDTKILCTLGPASSEKNVLVKMAESGMNVVRLNFSHGSHEEHEQKMNLIKRINKDNGFNIKIMQDLEGYRIRVGHFDKPKILNDGTIVYMSNEKLKKNDHIEFDYKGKISDFKEGYEIFIDDGQLFLKVVNVEKKRLKLRVIQGGILKQRKGINIPRLKLQPNILTEKDRRDIQFGVENNVDYIAQSFVRNKNDIETVKSLVLKKLPQCKIIAKIENYDGVQNIDSIIDSCEGIIVARGDLGVSFPLYKIPMIQKYIIGRSNRKKKITIVATQMLESMTEKERPTRAEVSDIANAVLDGTDFVMLSGETAVGKHPALCVQTMREVIDYTENFINRKF